jgi:glutamyl-tRNA synthetase
VPEAALLAELLQPRLVRLTDLAEQVRFLTVRQPCEPELYFNKKNKTSPDQAAAVLPVIREKLAALTNWNRETVHDSLMALTGQLDMKTGQLMWPLRIALSGQTVTPGGAIEIAVILGQAEALARLDAAVVRLSENHDQEDGR